MNRTAALLGIAATLALVALLVGVRRPPVPAADPGPVTAPVIAPAPLPVVPAATSGALSLVARTSHPVIPVGRSDVFLTADVTGQVDAAVDRSPVDLALVIDRSGSMSGQKIEDAKAAARALIAQLRPTDSLTIIHYGSDVRVLHRMNADATGKESMIAFVDDIQVDGGTNISAALQRARKELAGSDARVRRAILISDGVPTEGDTEPSHLLRLADAIHGAGISVSAIGVGLDFNENLMSGIAEHGSGAYGYLQDTSRLAQLFERDLQQASRMVARDVQLSFTLPQGATVQEVYGRTFDQSGRTVTVHLPDISSGQLERVVVRASVDGTTPGQRLALASVKLAYRDVQSDRDAQAEVAVVSQVSARQEEVLARRDTTAYVHATQAQAAANLEKASEAMRAGEKDKAEGFLQRNLHLFSSAEALAGAPAAALKGEAQWEQKKMDSFGRSADGDEGVLKEMHAHDRAAYGKVGSTYTP